MKIATWNINSVRQRINQALNILEKYDIDILCLQETKVSNDLFPFQPFLDKEFNIEATVLRHLSGSKIRVYKMRPKKKTRKTFGSRRKLTRVLINSIAKV